MPSMIEVAQRAGVSTATVSRVLANKPHVRPEVRERVLTAVAELGYRPNRVASSLRRQTSQLIGLLVSDIRNPFFTDVARAIEDIALANGHSLFLCNTDEDHEKEMYYLRNLISENVAGIILSPTTNRAEAFEGLLESDIPVVAIDRQIDGLSINTVLIDNFQAAYRLTQHIIEQGYRTLAAINGPNSSRTAQERTRGIQQALRDAGLPIISEHFPIVYPRKQEGYLETSRMLQADNRPDAIIAGNSRLTIGVFEAIQHQQMKGELSKKIAIAGFDETIWTSLLEGGITVISQPTYEMGKTAAELLLSLINKEGRSSREVILKAEMIIRRSTQSPGLE